MDNPVNKIPTEMWEMIISNVKSSKDLINLSKVIHTCKQIIHPNRNQWLFDQVFPLAFLHNLSKTDVLNCRLVCSRWKYGVDHFLQDNPINCPASGNDLDWKIVRCHADLIYCTLRETLQRERYDREDLEKFLMEPVYHPTNPFIGKYVNITFSIQDTSLLNHRFLTTFGKYIDFLKIDFGCTFDPFVVISKLILFLKMVPNLKGLEINRRDLNPGDKLAVLKFHRWEYLDDYYKSLIVSEEVKTGLPNVETLELKIEGQSDHFLKKVLIFLLKSDQLKSLSVDKLMIYDKIDIEIPSLLHLNLKVQRTEGLISIPKINHPNVRKLEVDLTECTGNFFFLLEVLQIYQSTLNHLHLGVPDEVEFRKKGLGEHKRWIRFFKQNGTLNMPNIKTISISGYRPPSLNFICGKGFESLEYLHITADKQANGPLQDYSKKVQRLDVIKRLGSLWADWIGASIPDMQLSNVWVMFPKLKVLKISRYRHLCLPTERTFIRNDFSIDNQV